MKHLLAVLAFVLSLNAAELHVFQDYNKAKKAAIEEKKSIMLMLYTSRCPWCKKMKNETLTRKSVIEFINKNYVFVMLHRDEGSYPQDLFPRYVPTIYTIDPLDDEESYALYGFKTPKQFLYELSKK